MTPSLRTALKISLPVLTIVAVASVLYLSCGRSVVEAAYNGESWSVLNMAIRGQDTFPLEYYLELADGMVGRCAGGAVVGTLALCLGILASEAHRLRRMDIPSIIAVTGTFVAVLFTPPVFARLFTLPFLWAGDAPCLWVLSAGVLACSQGLKLCRPPSRQNLGCVLASVLMLLTCELAVRFSVCFFPQRRMALAKVALETYPCFMAYQAHPFLQYTGAPSACWRGHRLLWRDSRFNNFGFKGDDFSYAKSNGVIRIACLGGSTTQAGYPGLMEDWLNGHMGQKGNRFEVLNFGLSGYNSTHSVVNFVLNVRDFSPDYVVVHHGWNDIAARMPRAPVFRGDFSHLSGPFQPPRIPDRYLIRASVIYRYVRHRVAPRPYYAALEGATARTGVSLSPTGHEGADIQPFARNVKTVIGLAKEDGIKAILATMPHSTDPNIANADTSIYIDQNNEILRAISREHKGDVVLVDLDETMTGKMDHLFTDLGHVCAEGDRYKATRIGQAILEHWRMATAKSQGEGDPPPASDLSDAPSH